MKRNNLIDFIRGYNLINMILFHAIWDMVYIFEIDVPWFETWIGDVWQILIAATFVILSGYCYRYSHNKLKQGLKVYGAGIIITLVTYIFMPENIIIFGVLTMLGTCMLLFIPFDKVLTKVNSVVGMSVSLLIYILTYNIDKGYIGIGYKLYLPKSLYTNYITTYIGLPYRGFYSTDYFGIIPWIFLYACGYFLNARIRDVKNKKKDASGENESSDNENCNIVRNIKNVQCRPINYLGKHSLIVYMIHQPIVYGVLYVIDMIRR